MAIDKLNLDELQDGIDSLEKWGEIHEEILDELVAVRELLEENKGESIDRIVEAIESLEDVARERAEEIFKKHKEVTNYKARIEESGVVATSSDAYIFIEDADELRKKIQRLINEVESHKRIHVNKANKTNISFGLENDEKEDLRHYIDKRNDELIKAKTYVESKIYEMETELKEALESAKQLEEMEDADLKFSIAHYNVVRKAIEIKVKIKKAVASKVIKIFPGHFVFGLSPVEIMDEIRDVDIKDIIIANINYDTYYEVIFGGLIKAGKDDIAKLLLTTPGLTTEKILKGIGPFGFVDLVYIGIHVKQALHGEITRYEFGKQISGDIGSIAGGYGAEFVLGAMTFEIGVIPGVIVGNVVGSIGGEILFEQIYEENFKEDTDGSILWPWEVTEDDKRSKDFI